MQYWQDIEPGQVFQTNSYALSEQEINEFAREFDPQPYHLDRKAADESIFGGLCASGWQLCAVTHRLLTEKLRQENYAICGVRAVTDLSWKAPVFVDTEFNVTCEITEKKPPADGTVSGLESGEVLCALEVISQDKLLARMTVAVLVKLGNEGAAND